jgi:mRNA interferase MazF
MILLERWDIGLVPFPFTDTAARVKRPALALSPESFNATAGSTIFAMITKAQFSAWPADYPIIDWRGAGLLLPSIARLKVFTLENSLILGRLGQLKTADIRGVRAAARYALW